MLPKKLRLSTSQATILRGSYKKDSSSNLDIYWTKTLHPNSRFQIQVPKSHVPLASHRNRLRRLIRSALMAQLVRLRFSVDAIVKIKTEKIESFHQAETEVSHLFTSAGLC